MAEWRSEQTTIARQIEAHERATPAPVADVRRLAARAAELFAQQPAHEKRKLLDCAVAGCV